VLDLHLQKPGTLREAVPDHLSHITQIAPLQGNGLQIKYHERIDNCRYSLRSESLAHRLLINLVLAVRINHWFDKNFFCLHIERFLHSLGVSRGIFEEIYPDYMLWKILTLVSLFVYSTGAGAQDPNILPNPVPPTGFDLQDYYITSTVNGTPTVTPPTLQISVPNVTTTYGTIPTLTPIYSGFVN
jgi:hypothetical protein